VRIWVANRRLEEDDTGPIPDIKFYPPAFKFQCSCWGPELSSFQMPIPATNWDRILIFVHNHLHLNGHGWSVCPTVEIVSQKSRSSDRLLSKNQEFYIHGSVHREPIFNNCPTRCELIILLHYCRQLYVFRLLTPIIRSWYSCNYSFWCWLTAVSNTRCFNAN